MKEIVRSEQKKNRKTVFHMLLMGVSALVLVVVGSGCPPTDTPESITVKGIVLIPEPLVGATVQGWMRGTPLYSDAYPESDETGVWDALVLPPLHESFRIETSGGSSLPQGPFEGTLSAYVPYKDISVEGADEQSVFDNIVISIPSTLVERYMRRTGKDYSSAIEDVSTYLEIPEEYDVLDPYLPIYIFAGSEFLLRAENYGGFEDFMASIIPEIGTGATQPMTPGNADGDHFGIIRYSFGTWCAYNMVCAAGGQLAGFALGKIWAAALPALGFETYEQEVRRNLKEINNELRQLNTKMDSLSLQVKNVMRQLKITGDQLIDQSLRLHISNSLTLLNEKYEDMIALFPDEGEEINAQKVHDFVDEIKRLHDIDLAIAYISQAVAGDSLLQTGSLDALTNLLIYEIEDADDKGEALARNYMRLENYFGDLLAAEMKGVLLMANLINYDNFNNDAKTYWDSPEEYVERKIKPRLAEQVSTFMTCVERLVVASANVRTIICGDYAMFPEEVNDVFRRADALAHQISPTTYPAGFFLHLVGDELIFPEITTPLNAPELGQANRIAIKGQTTRSYSALLPHDYADTAQGYLGWRRQNTTKWEFKLVDTIKVSTLHFPYYTPRSDDEDYVSTYGFKYGLVTDVKCAPISPDQGIDGLDLNTGQSEFFGTGTVMVRDVPAFCQTTHHPSETTVEDIGGYAWPIYIPEAINNWRAYTVSEYATSQTEDWDTKSTLANAGAMLINKFHKRTGYKWFGSQTMERNAAIQFMMGNMTNMPQPLEFKYAARMSAYTDYDFNKRICDFNEAIKNKKLFVEAEMRLWAGTKKIADHRVANYSKGRLGAISVLEDRKEGVMGKQPADAVSFQWDAKAQGAVKFYCWNKIDADSIPSSTSDKGSVWRAKHQLKYLEILPE